MNNRISLSGFVLFLSILMSSVSAQIGIKTGAGISDIAFLNDGQNPYLGYEINSLERRKPLMYLEAGAFGTIKPWKRIEFQPELLFAMQGLNFDTEYLYDHITYRIRIYYLKMPLLLEYRISAGKKAHPAVFIGPYAAWKLKAVRLTEIEGIKEKTNVPNVKNADFGIITGFSIDLDLLHNQLLFDLRMGYSLINMMDTLPGSVPSYYGPSKEYARNITISLTAGYRFGEIWSKRTSKP